MPEGHPAADLRRLIDGFKITQAIHVAAVLGVADHIKAGRRTSDAIAAAAGANRDALYRLLRTLRALGLLHENDRREFALTPMGECLASDAPHPLAPMATLTGQPYYWGAWGHLVESVRTGRNAFEAVHGMNAWTYRERHPAQNAIFNAAMSANARHVDDALVEALRPYRFRRVADIGGNQGTLLRALLHADHVACGLLFDQPHVVNMAVPAFRDDDLAGRAAIVGGDMFVDVPPGCDAYVLKFVLHDWEDADAIRILDVCRRRMPTGARLVAIERVIAEQAPDLAATLSDLNMLVVPGGRERTSDEFRALCSAGGLRLDHIGDTGVDLKLIVAVPA